MFRWVIGLIVGLGTVAAFASDRFEEAPILYSETEADNAISRLQDAIDSGEATLEYEGDTGYLKSVLDALDIAPASQVLVFSKTSFQVRYIAPESPRALYFNDDVYLGSVLDGDVLELSVADAELGAVFYTLSQRKSEKPRFVRQSHNCLQCHASTLTRGVPGHVVRSVFTDDAGYPVLRAGTHVTTQDGKFEERWGGWYVTGTHGAARHMGNAFAVESDNDVALDRDAGANWTSLEGKVDTNRYLADSSDIVALLVLQHQTEMHNRITNASFETRMALHRQAITDDILERDHEVLTESTQRVIANAGDKLVRYMLFIDEEEYEDPIAGSSAYAEAFASYGPRDSEGRSLRDLDLKYRLFEYPLSYLIYSEQFDGMPQEMKDYVYRRLWNILTGVEDTSTYLHLTNAKCRAILEILRETKDDLPDYWHE